MVREFLTPTDLTGVVAGQFGTDRRLVGLDRLTGGTKKGVYRLSLDDGTTAVLYLWAPAENYWPPRWRCRTTRSSTRPGPSLFAVNHAALSAAGVRVPRMLSLARYGESDIAPREEYGLVHGELGPDHVFVTPGGEPVMIDFEGLAYFDVEWDHAWLRMRFGEAYPALRPVTVDSLRIEFYQYAQVLSLIEGPLRIADTDFPDRTWMLDLAAWNIGKALAAI